MKRLAALTQDPAPEPEALLLAASLALAERGPAGAGHSPWSHGDGWRTGAAPVRSVGLRTPGFQRIRVSVAGDGIALQGGDARHQGRVESLGGGRFAVDAGRGARELELIRDRERLQVIGESAAEISLASAWPYERSVKDADAHPASPLPGRVVELRVKAGDTVARGDVFAVVEAMKMQHAIRAGRAGRITGLLARAGELVEAETVLFDIDG